MFELISKIREKLDIGIAFFFAKVNNILSQDDHFHEQHNFDQPLICLPALFA